MHSGRDVSGHGGNPVLVFYRSAYKRCRSAALQRWLAPMPAPWQGRPWRGVVLRAIIAPSYRAIDGPSRRGAAAAGRAI